MLILRLIRTALDNPPSMASFFWGLFMLSPVWVASAFPITRALDAIAPPWAWGFGGIIAGLLARWPLVQHGRWIVVGANAAMAVAWSYIAYLALIGHPVSPAMPLYILLSLHALDQLFAALGLRVPGGIPLDELIRAGLRARRRGGSHGR